MSVALFTPLTYLRIKHPLKRVVDRWFPVVGGAVAALTLATWPTFNLFGTSGAITGVDGLIQILAGFFITSLAAIATFNGSVYRIDEVLDGEKALLCGDALTRRQFLSFLFAYLALASVILYFFGVIAVASASTLHGTLAATPRMIERIAFAAAYFVILFHIAGTMLIGLIFLAGRIPGPLRNERYKVTANPLSDRTALEPSSPRTPE